jgi:hypothetical protein
VVAGLLHERRVIGGPSKLRQGRCPGRTAVGVATLVPIHRLAGRDPVVACAVVPQDLALSSEIGSFMNASTAWGYLPLAPSAGGGGVELEIVDEQLPEQHDPDRQGESE